VLLIYGKIQQKQVPLCGYFYGYRGDAKWNTETQRVDRGGAEGIAEMQSGDAERRTEAQRWGRREGESEIK